MEWYVLPNYFCGCNQIHWPLCLPHFSKESDCLHVDLFWLFLTFCDLLWLSGLELDFCCLFKTFWSTCFQQHWFSWHPFLFFYQKTKKTRSSSFGELFTLLFSFNHLIKAFCRQGGPPCQYINLLFATIWGCLTSPPNPMCRKLAFLHGRTSNGLKLVIITWENSHIFSFVVFYVEHIWYQRHASK